MIVSTATVHTSGINVESITIIVCTILATVGAGVGWTIRRLDANRRHTQDYISGQVGHVTEALAGRLDRVDVHLQAQDSNYIALSEKLARLQGYVEASGSPQIPRG
jgi:hypothetical protein